MLMWHSVPKIFICRELNQLINDYLKHHHEKKKIPPLLCGAGGGKSGHLPGWGGPNSLAKTIEQIHH